MLEEFTFGACQRDQSDSSLELRNKVLTGDKVQVFLEYEWIIHKQNKNEMNTKTKRSGA